MRYRTARTNAPTPDSESFLCVRGRAARKIVSNLKRLLHPMIRESRGSDSNRLSGTDATAVRSAFPEEEAKYMELLLAVRPAAAG